MRCEEVFLASTVPEERVMDIMMRIRKSFLVQSGVARPTARESGESQRLNESGFHA